MRSRVNMTSLAASRSIAGVVGMCLASSVATARATAMHVARSRSIGLGGFRSRSIVWGIVMEVFSFMGCGSAGFVECTEHRDRERRSHPNEALVRRVVGRPRNLGDAHDLAARERALIVAVEDRQHAAITMR